MQTISTFEKSGGRGCRFWGASRVRRLALAAQALGVVGLLLAGCTAPIGADKVSTRQAYAQVEDNVLRSGKPGADTVALLHRLDLDRLAEREPDEAVRRLHRVAVSSGERDLLFALAEMSHAAAERIRRNVKPWDARDPRDYYLGAAVYAYLFLFGEAKDAPPGAFDRRFRLACDLYNYGLALALAEPRGTNPVVRIEAGRRRLPVGELDLRLGPGDLPEGSDSFERFLMADQFRVRGLSVRNRQSGLGAPLVAVRPFEPALGIRRCSPVTVLLRLEGSLAEVDAGTSGGSLELYSALGEAAVALADRPAPLETDFTTHAAYVMNQSFVWDVGMMQFLSPGRKVSSRLLAADSFRADRIPVVFVHGTFSSPVAWAEMNNTLAADPVLRRQYQMWSFMYGSGNSLPISAAELRDALTAEVQKLDPEGTNTLLRQMVIIGHSQGGLLTKLTATETGDRIWRALNDRPLEEFPVAEDQRALLRRLLFVEPLPFVRRVVFISTPHRGSYLANSLARRLASRLMSLPSATIKATQAAASLAKGSSAERLLRGRLPTSLDSMSPRNPGLLALAEIPVAPTIHAHSIIPVKDESNLPHGRDGVVAYASAHVDYVESELVVRGVHSCQSTPPVIQEVRRILHQHLRELAPEGLRPPPAGPAAAGGSRSALPPPAAELLGSGVDTGRLAGWNTDRNAGDQSYER
jgi:pimeloyl-ACP methyl ester carboxylesterase